MHFIWIAPVPGAPVAPAGLSRQDSQYFCGRSCGHPARTIARSRTADGIRPNHCAAESVPIYRCGRLGPPQSSGNRIVVWARQHGCNSGTGDGFPGTKRIGAANLGSFVGARGGNTVAFLLAGTDRDADPLGNGLDAHPISVVKVAFESPL